MDVRFDIRPAEEGDLIEAEQLLVDCGLEIGGVADHFCNSYVVATCRDRLIGICGVERYNGYGLLRSVGVSRKWRKQSIGGALVANRIAWARSAGIRELFLLTIDAEHYFERYGFYRTRREDVPGEIKKSLEFSSICPQSAIVMRKALGDEFGKDQTRHKEEGGF